MPMKKKKRVKRMIMNLKSTIISFDFNIKGQKNDDLSTKVNEKDNKKSNSEQKFKDDSFDLI